MILTFARIGVSNTNIQIKEDNIMNAKEFAKDFVKTTAKMGEMAERMPLKGKTGFKIGMAVGLCTNPVVQGLALGAAAWYGTAKIAQKVVEHKGW